MGEVPGDNLDDIADKATDCAAPSTRSARLRMFEDEDEDDEDDDDDIDDADDPFCDTRNFPVYELETLYIRDSRYPNPLKYRIPMSGDFHCARSSLQNYKYSRYRSEESLNECIREYKEKLAAGALRHGEYKIIDDETLQIDLGIRRPLKKPSEKKIAEGMDHYGWLLGDANWTYHHLGEKFYKIYVSPYCREDQKEKPAAEADPFEWAFKRAQIANGMIAEGGLGHDCPPDYVEQPFKSMASLACNTVSEDLLAPCYFEMNGKRKSLLEYLENTLKEDLTPETVCFIMENADCLNVLMLCDPKVSDLLKKIKTCLENGLVLDRLSQLFEFNLKKKSSVKDALLFSLDFIVAVYGGDKKPWWFKENEDFTAMLQQSEKEGLDEDRLELAAKLAKASGFAFTYAWPLYREIGYKLSEVDGVGLDKSLQICSEVARFFGVGNIPRACNVMEFAVELALSVPVDKRSETLEYFEKHVAAKKPLSEIFGKMEGEDTSIHFPGLFCMVKECLGQDRAEKEELSCVTLKPTHLKELAAPLAVPLQQRAKTPPLIRIDVKNHLLLAANLDGQLLLPVAENLIGESSENDNSLLDLFRFYEQLRAECGWMSNKVADIYFAFFAKKMPKPFEPPTGFLRFLSKFENIPIPGHRDTLFDRGYEKEEKEDKNANLYVSKYLVITNLVDAWIIGIVGRDELMEVLNWMTEDAPDHLKKIYEQKVRAGVEKNYGHDDEERNSAYVSQETYPKVRDHEQSVHLDRFKTLASTLNSLILLNLMVTSGIWDQGDIKTMAGHHLAFLKTKSQDRGFSKPIDEARNVSNDTPVLPLDISNGSLTAWIKDFQELHEAGLSFCENFVDDFKTAGFESKIRMLYHLHDLIRKITESRELIKSSNNRMGELFENRNRLEVDDPLIAQSEFDNLMEQMEHVWKDADPIISPSIKKTVVTFLLEKYCAFKTYLGVLTIIPQIREQLFGEAPIKTNGEFVPAERELKRVTEVTANIVGVFTVLGRGDIFHHDVVEKKLPSAETGAADESDNKNVVSPEEPILQLASRIRDRVALACPVIKDRIIESRIRSMGLLPVGGKIHVLHKTDLKKFNAFKKWFNLAQTSFRLIEADMSINLPAVPSSGELSWIVEALECFQVIDRDYPELQVGIPGRLKSRSAAVLGSAILLATEKGVEYDEKAFSTTHDESTGARIMAYDSYGPLVRLPFMTALGGRTDMLGRRSLGDIELFQLLGSVLAQKQAGEGPFGCFADEFIQRYGQILKKYNLEDILDQNWIYKSDCSRYDNDRNNISHYQTVKKCTDAYFECQKEYDEKGKEEGIVFEVRALFEWLRGKVKKMQDNLYGTGDNQKACADAEMLVNF